VGLTPLLQTVMQWYNPKKKSACPLEIAIQNALPKLFSASKLFSGTQSQMERLRCNYEHVPENKSVGSFEVQMAPQFTFHTWINCFFSKIGPARRGLRARGELMSSRWPTN
jgi:hypothetical protein